jgi:SHS2 domain-containing protein
MPINANHAYYHCFLSLSPQMLYSICVKKDFEFIDHTADIGITAYGADMKQVFANAARGLFSIITNLDNVASTKKLDIQVTAPDREALLINWLNELIYFFETKEIIFNRFEITTITDTELKAKAYGEKINLAKHELKTQVKAATYHMLNIEQNEDGYQARVIFDV